MPENDAKIRNLSCFLNKNERKKNDSRGILHCASTIILSVFLANKNKIISLFNVLNVIFFYKKLFFSLLLFKIHKKRLRKWLIPCPSTVPKLFLIGLNSFRIRPKSVSTNPKMSFQYWIELFDPYPNKFGLIQNRFWTCKRTRHKESVLSLSTTISYPQVPIIIF